MARDVKGNRSRREYDRSKRAAGVPPFRWERVCVERRSKSHHDRGSRFDRLWKKPRSRIKLSKENDKAGAILLCQKLSTQNRPINLWSAAKNATARWTTTTPSLHRPTNAEISVGSVLPVRKRASLPTVIFAAELDTGSFHADGHTKDH